MQVEDSGVVLAALEAHDGDAGNNNNGLISCSYDEVFPALPDSAPQITQRKNKMRVSSSDVTQFVKVKAEERKYDENDSFGERESVRTCKNITKDTQATIEMSISRDQSLTFLVNGKPDNVNEARRKILAHFQTQANRSVAIPKEHHKWVLGKQGQRLKDLERATETKITVPSMMDGSETITVTGTEQGIEKAIHEIKTISDEQSKKASEKVSVPRMYLPFVCGPHNNLINSMMAETGTKITVFPANTENRDEVAISGSKEGVAAAKDRILTIVKEMEERCTTVSVEVVRTQHRYVVGPKGSSIAEILEKTGVVVEMPTADATSTIILRGPQERLGVALNLVYEKANSVMTKVVDVPHWIHRHIIGKRGDDIKKLKEDFPKVHVEFVDKEDKIRIEGPLDEVKIAQEKIMSKANELINSLTHTTLTVDPKYYKHIIGKNGANVNRLKEQTDAMINISGSESNIIRIEGSKQAVSEAKRELMEMIAKLENETEMEVVIEHQYHSSIIGQKGEKIREINSKFNQEVQITFPNANEKKDVVKVRGPKEEVQRCVKHLKALVVELAESRYSIRVPINKQCHKNIIGKKGGNIRMIKEETHTKIDLPAEGEDSNVITITGKKENVEDARDRILKIQNEQANIVTEEVHVDKVLLLNRKLVKAIAEECNNINIRLPQKSSPTDKVVIRGQKEDVEQGVQQLLKLATESSESCFSAEVRAKPQHFRHFFRKSGAKIKLLRESTGCRILFPSEQDEDQELITIIGKQENVQKAKQELEAICKDIDNIVEEEMTVEPRLHKHFLQRRNGMLLTEKISDECGGVTIRFPRQGVQSDCVVLRGSPDNIAAARLRVQQIVQDLLSQVTIECVIPHHHHRSLTGPKHIKAHELSAAHNVTIKFPERVINDDCEKGGAEEAGVNGGEGEAVYMNGGGSGEVSQSDIILITGQPDKCEEARQALLSSVPVTETVDVPFDYHRGIIGYKGQTIRELSTRLDVHITVPPSTEQANTITVTGSRANMQLAREAILDKMAEIDADNEDRKLKSFDVKLNVPAEYFPKIIGKKGSIINRIRDDHGVQINLPQRGSEDENTITIVGYQSNAEKAAEVIMKIVNDLDSLAREEVQLDARIHPRLIGSRGRNIRKVMDEYRVEIKFARPNDPNPDTVIIVGADADVADAKDHLLELQEQFMMDLDYESEYRAPKLRNEEHEDSNPFMKLNANLAGSENGSNAGTGFVVKNAPWEQKAPDTASTQEFPSFGSGPIHTPTHSGAWGPRR